eukprot:156924-Amorphochlora_amoeboformis.AAC.1
MRSGEGRGSRTSDGVCRNFPAGSIYPRRAVVVTLRDRGYHTCMQTYVYDDISTYLKRDI